MVYDEMMVQLELILHIPLCNLVDQEMDLNLRYFLPIYYTDCNSLLKLIYYKTLSSN